MTTFCAVGGPAFEKTKAQVSQRRLRLDDFFSDFDRLHTGRLTAPQFCRVLALNHIKLSEPEMIALASVYQFTGGAAATGAPPVPTAAGVATIAEFPEGIDIDYTAFLEALRSSSSGGGGAVSADSVPAAATASTTGTYSRFNPAATVINSPLTQAEEDLLRPTIHILRHAIRSRGITIVPPFRDMDPLNTGVVTISQFERCLPIFHTLKPEVVKLFAKKYGDGQGNVIYMLWCRDVDETLRIPATDADATMNSNSSNVVNNSGNFLHSFGVGTYTNAGLTAPELVRVIREQCALYRLRCDDFLTDFDRNRCGTVSAAQFESGVGRVRFVRFALTTENIGTLVAAYATNGGSGGYSGCNDDTTVVDIAHLPDAAIRVRYLSFLFDTNPKNFEADNSATASSGGGGAGNARAYWAQSHAADAFLSGDDKDAEAVGRTLAKVRRLVQTNRIFLSPVLRDFDRACKAIHEHRTCTSSRFARGLATQNILLSSEELRVLIKKYTMPSADGSPSDDVNYYQFVGDVDPTQAKIAPDQPEPQRQQRSMMGATVNPTTTGAGTAVMRTTAGGTVERPVTTLDVILQTIASQCAERELRAGDFFFDFDPLRSDMLLPSHFVTALTISGIKDLSQEQLEALVAAFPVRGGTTHSASGCTLPNANMNANTAGLVDVHAFLTELGAYGGAPAAGSDYTCTGGLANANTATVLTSDDEARLARVLRRLRHDVTSHSALLAPFFADFDHFGRGKITANNFRQALARHRFPLSDEDSALLCRVYSASGTAVNPAEGLMGEREVVVDWRRFVSDVSDEATVNYITRAATAAAATAATDPQQMALSAPAAAGTWTRTAAAPAAPVTVHDALARVCCFLQERQPRAGEFFPDGDELRHGVVTRARFRHCVVILGVQLTEEEMAALERGFAVGPANLTGNNTNTTNSGGMPSALLEVDYPAFVRTVREMIASGYGVTAVQERRKGETTALFRSMKAATADGGDATTTANSNGGGGAVTINATQAEAALATTVAKIRRCLASRRTGTLAAFREYDRQRRGFVKEGQFFGCLTAVLGMPLTPLEAAVITKAFSLGNGEMGYVRFCDEVDSTAFDGVS